LAIFRESSVTYAACVGELINNQKVLRRKWVLNFCKYGVVARKM